MAGDLTLEDHLFMQVGSSCNLQDHGGSRILDIRKNTILRPSDLDIARYATGLEKATAATIPIYEEDDIIGTGFVVTDGDRKYLVSADHVFTKKSLGVKFERMYFKPKGEDGPKQFFKDTLVVYQDGRERGFNDVIVWEYDGTVGGVRVSRRSPSNKQVLFTVGYPGVVNRAFGDEKQTIAFGRTYSSMDHPDLAPTVDAFMKGTKKLNTVQKVIQRVGWLLKGEKVYFYGAVPQGFSGGGLFDQDGNVSAVVSATVTSNQTYTGTPINMMYLLSRRMLEQ